MDELAPKKIIMQKEQMPIGTHNIKYLKNILINYLRIANIIFITPFPQPLQDLPLIPHPPILCPQIKKKKLKSSLCHLNTFGCMAIQDHGARGG